MASTANAFTVGDYVVYPKHRVGRVIELQREEIAGMQLELYVLRFEKERMTLRVPVGKVALGGSQPVMLRLPAPVRSTESCARFCVTSWLTRIG